MRMIMVLAAAIMLAAIQSGNTASEKKEQQEKKQSVSAVKKKAEKKDIKVTFVELGSVNCIPCKAMQPVMKAIEEEYGDQVEVVFYDVWTKEGSVYGEKYKIRLIPTQVFLDKDGKEYSRHEGFYPKEEIIKVLERQGVAKKQTPKTAPKSAESGKQIRTGEVCE